MKSKVRSVFTVHVSFFVVVVTGCTKCNVRKLHRFQSTSLSIQFDSESWTYDTWPAWGRQRKNWGLVVQRHEVRFTIPFNLRVQDSWDECFHCGRVSVKQRRRIIAAGLFWTHLQKKFYFALWASLVTLYDYNILFCFSSIGLCSMLNAYLFWWLPWASISGEHTILHIPPENGVAIVEGLIQVVLHMAHSID